MTLSTTQNNNNNNHNSIHQFLQGTILYILCIALPTIYGITVHILDDYILNGPYFLHVRTYLLPTTTTASTSTFSIKSRAGIIHEYSDVQLVVLLTLVLSVFRMMLVRRYVPNFRFHSQPKQMSSNTINAFARNKSTVFLSSLATSTDENEIESENEIENEKKHEQKMDQNDTTNTVETQTKYATAVFRLCYSIAVTLFTFLYFRNADFFYVFVGDLNPRAGLERAVHACYSLKYGISALLPAAQDPYFDAMKYFYLIQAAVSSFHFCFVFSVMGSKKSFCTKSVRSCIEYVILILYVCSSLYLVVVGVVGTYSITPSPSVSSCGP